MPLVAGKRLSISTTLALLAAAAPAARAALIVPSYDSRPAAFSKLYLDFIGDDNTPNWEGYHPNQTPAYNIDANPNDFSTQEQDNIHEIWSRVAEKYSPFNLNVTTVDPHNANDGETMRVIVGGAGSWLGASATGVAFVGSFTNGLHPNQAFVFSDKFTLGDPFKVAETITHESGHGFGLNHQSTYGPGGKTEYNTGTPEKAPIMGESRYSARGLWWLGTSSLDQAIIQDDLAILSAHGLRKNNFGFRTDDHTGTTYAAADPLTIDESDISGSGVIEQTSDVDWFSFSTPGGILSVSANVAQYGPMLDLSLGLYDSQGNLLALSATSSLSESIQMALPLGSYELAVSSAGNYGDIGQFTISGSMLLAAAPEPSGLFSIAIVAPLLIIRRRTHSRA